MVIRVTTLLRVTTLTRVSIQSCQGSSRDIRVYLGFIQGCQGLSRVVRVYLGLSRVIRVYLGLLGLLGFIQECQGLSRIIRVYLGLLGFIQGYQGLSRVVRVVRVIGVYLGLLGFFGWVLFVYQGEVYQRKLQICQAHCDSKPWESMSGATSPLDIMSCLFKLLWLLAWRHQFSQNNIVIRVARFTPTLVQNGQKYDKLALTLWKAYMIIRISLAWCHQPSGRNTRIQDYQGLQFI